MPFAENKATICWPNHTDACALTTSNVFTRPLDRLKIRTLKDRAITTDLTCQFTATLDRSRPVGVAAIVNHNLSTTALMRVRLYDEADELLEDSGQVGAWVPVYSSLELAWENPNFWSGLPDDEDRARFSSQAIFLANKNWYVKKVVIDIMDDDNDDSFIQMGRLFLSEVFQPDYNISYGVQWNLSDPTLIDESLDGTEFFEVRPQVREVTMAFDFLSEQEAFSRMFRMRRDVGVSGEILFFHQINIDSRYPQRTMLARASQADPVVHPDVARHTHNLSLKELI